MTVLSSLALLALQIPAGSPPGADLGTPLRMEARGDYKQQSYLAVADDDSTFVFSWAETPDALSWTRTRLDAQGAEVWTESDFQSKTSGAANPGTWHDLVLVPSAGLLLAMRLDARSGGTYDLLAYRTSDGIELWRTEVAANPSPGAFWFEKFSRLLVHEPAGVVHLLSEDVASGHLRTFDLQTGACVASPACALLVDYPLPTIFRVFDVELSADGQRLYVTGQAQTQPGVTGIDGHAFAVDVSSGALLWQITEVDRPIYRVEEQPGSSHIALYSTTDFLLQNPVQGGRLWSVDGLNGAEIWSQSFSASFQPPSELKYTPDGQGLLLGRAYYDSLFSSLFLGGILDRYASADGSLVWRREEFHGQGGLDGKGTSFTIGVGNVALWSYGTSGSIPLFGQAATMVVEGVDLATGNTIFALETPGLTHGGLQKAGSNGEFLLGKFGPLTVSSVDPPEYEVFRLSEMDGSTSYSHKVETEGPVPSYALNLEVTDDAKHVAVMRYVESSEPRVEVAWVDRETGQELWLDVLPSTSGLQPSNLFEDRNREMLLSPDESTLITVVRGDSGQAYSTRVRAYSTATGSLRWSETFASQRGPQLHVGPGLTDGLTRPGNRGVEVTDEAVFIVGNPSAVGGMLLASRGLLDGAPNWTLLSEAGVTSYLYSCHLSADESSLYAAIEAPSGALLDGDRRVVRVDQVTGAILGFFDFDTEGYVSTLLAKGNGAPVLVSDLLESLAPVGNSRLVSPDLSAELGFYPNEKVGVALTPGEGYLISRKFQVADIPSPGELNVDLDLAASLGDAPGGIPSGVDALERGQLAYHLIEQNPLAGQPDRFLRVWDASSGEFMLATPLFEGAEFPLRAVTHLEGLPGRAGFVAEEWPGSDPEPQSPGPDVSAPSAVVQVVDLPELIVQPTEVSLSAGAQLDYWLRRNGDASGPQAYLLLGALDEVSNGPVLDGVSMPFSASDPYTLLTLTQANQANFVETLGVLDEFGNARARINSPAGLDPALVGETFHYAWLTVDLAPLVLVSDVSHTVQTLKLP